MLFVSRGGKTKEILLKQYVDLIDNVAKQLEEIIWDVSD